MAKETLKSVTKSNGSGSTRKETRVEVRNIENGFIIRKTIEFNDPKKGWQYITKEYYSESDPLEITDKSLAELFD
jgi:hypothetical protein